MGNPPHDVINTFQRFFDFRAALYSANIGEGELPSIPQQTSQIVFLQEIIIDALEQIEELFGDFTFPTTESQQETLLLIISQFRQVEKVLNLNWAAGDIIFHVMGFESIISHRNPNLRFSFIYFLTETQLNDLKNAFIDFFMFTQNLDSINENLKDIFLTQIRLGFPNVQKRLQSILMIMEFMQARGQFLIESLAGLGLADLDGSANLNALFSVLTEDPFERLNGVLATIKKILLDNTGNVPPEKIITIFKIFMLHSDGNFEVSATQLETLLGQLIDGLKEGQADTGPQL